MPSIEPRLEELKAELEKAVKEHNQAFDVVTTAKNKIMQLQGAVAALSEFVETDQLEETDDATPASVEVA